MRIVYLNPCGSLGGAETSLRELLASVRTAEPDWDLWLVLGEDGPLAEAARRRGVQVVLAPFPEALARVGDAAGRWYKWPFRLTAGCWAALRYKRRLGEILDSIHPDLVHSNGLKMHLLGAWTHPRGTPVVWHIHDYLSRRRLGRALLRLAHRRCSVAVSNSHSVAEDLRSLLPGLKTYVIYNAIDLQRFSPGGPKLDLDDLAGLRPAAPGAIRVGLVATFAKWKGHLLFLQALSRLSGDVPFRGYIIGGPIYRTVGSQWTRTELEAEVDRLQLRGKVGFTGFVEDTPGAMRALDVVVHASSEPEPFGMVIVEGMACGVPVIASQAGGAAELFTHGENALGYAPGDAAGLARQIGRLLRDGGLRKRLAEAGRRNAERLCEGSRLAAELLRVYREQRQPSAALPIEEASFTPEGR